MCISVEFIHCTEISPDDNCSLEFSLSFRAIINIVIGSPLIKLCAIDNYIDNIGSSTATRISFLQIHQISHITLTMNYHEADDMQWDPCWPLLWLALSREYSLHTSLNTSPQESFRGWHHGELPKSRMTGSIKAMVCLCTCNKDPYITVWVTSRIQTLEKLHNCLKWKEISRKRVS